ADGPDPLGVGLRARAQERHRRPQVGELALRVLVAAWPAPGLAKVAVVERQRGNPAAASRSAYKPVTWSRTPVNGPVKTSPGAGPPADGARRPPTSAMPSTPNPTRSIARLQTAQNAAGLPQPQPAAGLPASPAADEAPGRLGISGRLSGDYRITPAWGARRPNSGLPVPAGFGYPPSTLSLAGPVARLFAPLRAVAGCRGCQAEVMDVDVLFAGIPVSDFEAAKAWYERFFARPADVVANEAEVMWQVTDRGWLDIGSDAGKAGNSGVAMALPGMGGAATAVAGREVCGPVRSSEKARRAGRPSRWTPTATRSRSLRSRAAGEASPAPALLSIAGPPERATIAPGEVSFPSRR